MGGSNQSLFLIGALVLSQGSAAIPLLALGLVLSLAAAPGWTELVLMWPNRVGGIAATCAEAFRPYNPVLANIAGVCYWWGWVPTCGLTAILSATAIQEWYLSGAPIPLLASGLVLLFTVLFKKATRPITVIERLPQLRVPFSQVWNVSTPSPAHLVSGQAAQPATQFHRQCGSPELSRLNIDLYSGAPSFRSRPRGEGNGNDGF
jgi:hypothetical protein